MERYKRPCVMHLPSLPLGLDPLFRVRSYPVRHWQDSLYPEYGVAPPFRVRRFPCRFVMSAIPAIDQQHELISRLSDVSSFSRITATHLLENGLTLYHPHIASNGQMRYLSILLRNVPRRRSNLGSCWRIHGHNVTYGNRDSNWWFWSGFISTFDLQTSRSGVLLKNS